MIRYAPLVTPLGRMSLQEEDGFITALHWSQFRGEESSDLLQEATAQLMAYFEGRLQRFSLPLAADSTGFAHGVNEAMMAIPYGETKTYGEIAKGLEVTPQAVGQACGANPIPIIIPCHRVVGATNLGGFSGRNGIESKVALLKLEGAASLLI